MSEIIGNIMSEPDVTEPLCRVDVFGSCVSRSIFHNGNPEAKGCADSRK